MRSRLRLFALVGLGATAVDVFVLHSLQSWGLLLADAMALLAASIASYLGNRTITFRGARTARWVRRPSVFAVIAVVAGALDIALLWLLNALGLSLLVAKAPAVLAAATIRWAAYRRVLFAQVRQELAQRSDRPPSSGELRLSVVVPAFNESGLIEDTIKAIESELEPAVEAGDYEIVVVDDGSTDDTVGRAGAAGARVLVQDANRGKGAAVRAGMLDARGRTVVFTDADLAYPPAHIVDVLNRIEDGWDVVVGSRRHEDTNTLVKARRLRELGGRVINLLTHLVLLGAFHDTQCGLKGFRRDIAVAMFERTRIDGFAFDVEIFLLAEQDRLSLTEIPVSVRNRAGSSVRIVGDTLSLLRDLIRVRRWAGADRYQPNESQRQALAAVSETSGR